MQLGDGSFENKLDGFETEALPSSVNFYFFGLSTLKPWKKKGGGQC